ncbi:unnamed protein product [Nyctereutes procyonoides]|uniref:(raccoon dog) hypothetical protein n=1 Tax=Nyctereutes procyonoides TaxID=34880 RepID=A0A811Y0R6_NYCPR|nr:unnamed protein product [Nyctereutes procyonoides]
MLLEKRCPRTCSERGGPEGLRPWPHPSSAALTWVGAGPRGQGGGRMEPGLRVSSRTGRSRRHTPGHVKCPVLGPKSLGAQTVFRSCSVLNGSGLSPGIFLHVSACGLVHPELLGSAFLHNRPLQ